MDQVMLFKQNPTKNYLELQNGPVLGNKHTTLRMREAKQMHVMAVSVLYGPKMKILGLNRLKNL